MKRRRWLLAALLLTLLWAAPASAQNRIIVRTTLGQTGLESLLQPLCLLQTCNVVGPLDGSLGQLFLVTTSLEPTTLINLLRPLLGIVDAEVDRSEEHTSELQSLTNLVCRLLLEKKKIYTRQ